MTDIAEAAERLESVAGHVMYLAEYDKKDPAGLAADLANSTFYRINVLSGLTPTEALLIAGCLDAHAAHAEGLEIQVDTIVRAYWERTKAEYIEKVMLGALDKLVDLLSYLDRALASHEVPTSTRKEWVRRGLDFPPGDSLATQIQRTHLELSAWDDAQERAEIYVQYVSGLPFALRSGQVPLDSVLDSVATALGASS